MPKIPYQPARWVKGNTHPILNTSFGDQQCIWGGCGEQHFSPLSYTCLFSNGIEQASLQAAAESTSHLRVALLLRVPLICCKTSHLTILLASCRELWSGRTGVCPPAFEKMLNSQLETLFLWHHPIFPYLTLASIRFLEWDGLLGKLHRSSRGVLLLELVFIHCFLLVWCQKRFLLFCRHLGMICQWWEAVAVSVRQ